jgi:hypothetical protein
MKPDPHRAAPPAHETHGSQGAAPVSGSTHPAGLAAGKVIDKNPAKKIEVMDRIYELLPTLTQEEKDG